MGTIAEKLTYLNTTKTMLRDSLNKFGSSILTTDTFRSYDTKLNEIYDKLPKVTQSGAGFTLENVQNGQVDDFKMIGTDLVQSATTGKNLFDKDNANIITAYIGDSYNWTFSGSAICYRINCKPNTSYTISCANSNETIFRGSVTDSEDIPTSGNNLSIYSTVRRTNNSPITVNTGANAKYVLVQLSNTQYLTSLETLQVEEGSSVTSYEPYTGGIPSPNPDYPQDINVVEGRQVITDKGKNLFDKNNANIIVASFSQDYKTISQISNNAKILYISCKENTTYTVSKISSARFRILTTDIVPALEVTGIDFIQNDTSTSLTITTSSNVNYLCVYYFINGTDTLTEQEILDSIQIEEGSTATDYEPYYNPLSYNIDLNLENIYLAKMPNTDYKNRIYRNNGNWYFEEKVKKIVLDGSQYWDLANSGTDNYSYRLVLGRRIINGYGISSHYPYQSSIVASNTVEGFNILNITNTTSQIRIRYGTEQTTENFRSWLSNHNVTVWYVLENSTTTQITNTTLINQLEAISVHTGTNIITISNDNNIIPEIEITRLKELEKLA